MNVSEFVQTMIRINDIIDKVTEYHPDAALDIIDRAYIYSAKVHDGQVRLSGEPYLSHPLEVAWILADMKLDVVSVAAGLLHDVIEDTSATPEDLKNMFGNEVAHIVLGVTKLSTLSLDSSQAREAESIKKMVLAMADDIRVILVKLADRLHNMRTLQFQKENRKKKIAMGTLDIYAPIADRLGIYKVKKELEDISFKYLQPEEYSKVKSLVGKDKEKRERYIETVRGYIKKKMEEEGLKCEVVGRHKHLYSIYQKMMAQHLAFEDVYDVIAFRVILDTEAECYKTLGHIHALWIPVAKRFKDYIGYPKPNGYKAIHTTVIGPFGERMEIQIRTWEMDRTAKFGVAAHWSYKEGKRINEKTSKTFSWIQNLIEDRENFKEPGEFLENVRIDLFPDEVYLFTPTGEIKSISKGATPVDFAYLIHTEVGSRCVGAKVNGRMVPLQHELKTGDTVEIITSKNSYPSRDWLNFVKTVKARSKIRQWIKTQEKERSLALGQEMCEKAFRKHRLNFNTLQNSEDMKRAAEHFNFKTVDDLIAGVGYGKITPLQVVRKIVPKPEPEEKGRSILNRIIEKVRKKREDAGIIVKGVNDILIRFGKCCQPVPGDSITGYITQGYGVTVHRVGCVNALKMNPERQIDVEWNRDAAETYPVNICIRSYDRVGLLSDIAASISKGGANILSVKSETRENRIVDSLFTLSVENIEHLNTILSSIKKIKLVHKVERVDG